MDLSALRIPRCKRFCYDDIPNGIFTDQRWNDLVPAIFPEVKILRNSRYNVAAWNTTLRKIERDKTSGQWRVDGQPLGFYHFTGIDSGAHYNMVRQFSRSASAQVAFVKEYEVKMREAARDPLCQRKWAFADYSSGEMISKPMRVYVRQDGNMAKIFKNPFDAAELPRSFRDWYRENLEEPARRAVGAVGCGGDPVANLRALCDTLVRENSEMKNSLSWRMTMPLRWAKARVRSSQLYVLLKKTKKNLSEYGLAWTFRKIKNYVLKRRASDVECARVIAGIGESFCIGEDVLSRAFAAEPPVGADGEDVTIVVPVYNGLVHLKRLIPGLLANTPDSVGILLVNDASSDPAVAVWLDGLVRDTPGRLTLKTNEENLGFVKTVTNALKATRGHVIILNSDTEVPPGWVERLLRCLNPHVASVTPFSNAAALMSFPDLDGNNRWLIEQFATEEIDAAFRPQILQPELRVAPVGVGFCMLMNRAVINKIGLFDEQNFGKGYGEEADWCTRAFDAGYENVIASDLFVSHYDGGSFSVKQKTVEAFEHEKIFSCKHPDFHGRRFLPHKRTIDPYWDLARNMAMLRFFTSRRFKPILILQNGLVGGSAAYLSKYRNIRDRTVVYASPTAGAAVLTIQYNDFIRKFKAESFDVLTRHGLFVSCTEIVVNHLLKWEQYFGTPTFSPHVYAKAIDMIVALKAAFKAHLTFAFHDFFSICPCYVLLDSEDLFCRPSRDVARCTGCLAHSAELAGVGSLAEMEEWRRAAARLFGACDELRFFSGSTRDILSCVVPIDSAKVRVAPHAPLADFKPVAVEQTSELRIGIVGGINRCKGANFIEDFAHYLARADPAARIVIIGAIDHPPYPPNVTVHGSYDHAQLPGLVKKYGINVGFVSSICPETFSYVTQELMQMEIPTACFNLGAPAERLMKWAHGTVIKKITPEAAYQAISGLFNKEYRER